MPNGAKRGSESNKKFITKAHKTIYSLNKVYLRLYDLLIFQFFLLKSSVLSCLTLDSEDGLCESVRIWAETETSLQSYFFFAQI